MILRIAATSLAVLLIFANASQAQVKGTFEGAIDYAEGGIQPIQTAVGDFNGDGKPDLIVADSSSIAGTVSVVRVFLSNGDGTFQPAITYSNILPSLMALAVGDFNGDGKLDVAVVSDYPSGKMLILLGNGDGTFQPKVQYDLGGTVLGANTIAVGDFNGDGRVDLVVGVGSLAAIEVLVGNGDGTFQTPNSYPTQGNGPLPVAVGDFNKDGKLDVAVANPYVNGFTTNSSLTVCSGNGDGTLGNSVTTLMPYLAPTAIAVGDLNSDGNPDLAVTGYLYAIVALGNGDGTFQTPISYSLAGANNGSANGGSITITDMNGDGFPDLAIGGTSTGGYMNAAILFLNDGHGNFGSPIAFAMGGWSYASLAVADFNGDGKKDFTLVSGCSESSVIDNHCPDGTLSVLLGNGDGTTRSAKYVDTGTSSGTATVGVSVAAGDFNGDGVQDIVFPACSISSCNSGFALMLGDGSGGYQPPVIFSAPAPSPRFIAVGDFNADGKPDVAVFNDSGLSITASSVSIFLNTGNGTFAPPVVYESGGVGPLTITTGDFNGDGKLDLAMLHINSSSQDGNSPALVGILLGNGDGTFQPAVTTLLPPGINVSSIAAADFNRDGKTDLVVSELNNNGSNPNADIGQTLISKGDGTFQLQGFYTADGYGNVVVTTGDLNGDGNADLIFVNRCDQGNYNGGCFNGSVGVWLGNGDGTFQFVNFHYVVPDGNLYGVSLADVNNDGKLDLIASTGTGVSVSFGNGDGTFQQPTIYAALPVSQNVQLAVADLNGDGGLDIVQPGLNGNLAVLYNQGFAKSSSVVTLHSSLNPSVYGHEVTFSADVTSSGTTPTGTLTFSDGGTVFASGPLINGHGAFSTAVLTAGTHSIVATYSGDAAHTSSMSTTLQQVVNKQSSFTGLGVSANPSYVNQSITFFADVGPVSLGTFTGTMTFKQGTATLATVPVVNGKFSTFTTSYTTPGSHAITAIYSGDGNNLGSSSLVVSQIVKPLPAATATKMTTSGSPSFINQPVTITAAVTSTYGPIPDGETITFSDGLNSLGSASLTGGVATLTTTALKAGNHSIKGAYSGDATFKPSAGSVKQLVTLYPSSTSTPSSSQNPSLYGQAVTFTVTVTSAGPSTPTGTVAFKNGTASIGVATLGGGVATLTKSNLPYGSLSITAVYNGDAQTAKSTSPPLNQVVNQASTSTTLVSSRNPSILGNPVTLTATVAPQTSGAATGAITFMDGPAILATVNIASNAARYSTSAFTLGAHSITAAYSGDTQFGPSSAALTQTVNPRPGCVNVPLGTTSADGSIPYARCR